MIFLINGNFADFDALFRDIESQFGIKVDGVFSMLPNHTRIKIQNCGSELCAFIRGWLIGRGWGLFSVIPDGIVANAH
jgi:hypothetical protein